MVRSSLVFWACVFLFVFQSVQAEDAKEFENVFACAEPVKVEFLISYLNSNWGFELQKNVKIPWQIKDVLYGNFSEQREKNYSFVWSSGQNDYPLSEEKLHVKVDSTNPLQRSRYPGAISSGSTKSLARRFLVEDPQTFFLLNDTGAALLPPPRKAQLFWIPKWTALLSYDTQSYPSAEVIPYFHRHYATFVKYTPPFFLHHFEVKKKDLMPVDNFSLGVLPLNLNFEFITRDQTVHYLNFNQILKFYDRLFQSFDLQMNEFETALFKFAFDTKTYLLPVFSIFHILFDLYSLQNGINFYGDTETHFVSSHFLFLSFLLQTVSAVHLFVTFAPISTVGLAALTALVGLVKLFVVPKNSPQSPPKGKFVVFVEILSYLSLIGLSSFHLHSTLLNDKHSSWLNWFSQSLVFLGPILGVIAALPQIALNFSVLSTEGVPVWNVFFLNALSFGIDSWFVHEIKAPALQKISFFGNEYLFLIFLLQNIIFALIPKRKAPQIKKKKN